MVDTLSPEKRSWNMGRVRSSNTKPEIIVRSLLHRNGFRFKLHSKELPGKPDIVLPKYHTVILVHGCFWHRHKGCSDATTPKTRATFWNKKFAGNIQRDKRTEGALRDLGWKVIVVWECETSEPGNLIQRLQTNIKASSNKAIRDSGSDQGKLLKDNV